MLQTQTVKILLFFCSCSRSSLLFQTEVHLNVEIRYKYIHSNGINRVSANPALYSDTALQGGSLPSGAAEEASSVLEVERVGLEDGGTPGAGRTCRSRNPKVLARYLG